MRRLIELPEGVTATRGARIALTVLRDLGREVALEPGRYRCRTIGRAWAAGGAWLWWLEGPGGAVICGSQWPAADLWAAHRKGRTWAQLDPLARDVTLGAFD